MADQPSSALTLLTACFSAAHLEASARRTGVVKRASQMPGQLFLALVTCGVWSEAHPSLAPWAAQVMPLDDQLAIAPEAIYPRMNKGALALLQDMIRQALAQVHGLEKVGEEGLLPGFTKVSLAESTGLALPDRRHALFPGSGGSAAKAGAKMHAVWDYKSSVLEHCALTPWHRPDQPYIDTVVALAHKGIWFLFD